MTEVAIELSEMAESWFVMMGLLSLDLLCKLDKIVVEGT